MFGRFKKKGKPSAQPRRNARLRWQTVRRTVGSLTLLTLLGSAGYLAFNAQLVEDTRNRAVSAFHTHSVAAGFAVRDILVTGRQRTAEKELLDALAIAAGTPVFSISLPEAQARLEQLTWVERAHISRHLPDTILIHIEERVPVALWQFKRRISLIDSGGKIITDKGLDAFSDLPLVVGEDAPAHIKTLTALLKAEPVLAEKTVSAVRVGNRRWDLRLKNGIDVRLPEKQVELALSRLGQAVRQDNLLEKDIAVIDLRLPDRMTVTPKNRG